MKDNDILLKRAVCQMEREIEELYNGLVKHYCSGSALLNECDVREYIGGIALGDVLKMAESFDEPKKEFEPVSERTAERSGMRRPNVVVLNDTTEKIVILNPCVRKTNWKYQNIVRFANIRHPRTTDEVVYQLQIKGRDPYFVTIKDGDKKALYGAKNTYCRMFPYEFGYTPQKVSATIIEKLNVK